MRNQGDSIPQRCSRANKIYGVYSEIIEKKLQISFFFVSTQHPYISQLHISLNVLGKKFSVYRCTVLAEISHKDRILEPVSFTVTLATVNCMVSKKKSANLPSLMGMSCCRDGASINLCHRLSAAAGSSVLGRAAACPRSGQHPAMLPDQLLKPSNTNWLALFNYVNQLLEQWTALEHFFLAAYVEDKLVSASRCLEIMRNSYNKAYLFFLRFSLKSITVFNALF